jgi:osmotically-inducible protein OsmY
VVRLSGVVGSAAEKRQARYDAWVTGVEDVRVEELSVQRWARDEDLRGDKYEALSDGEIAAAVEAALAVNPRTNSFEIIVKVEDGVVTLAGSVDNLKSKREAAETARSTVGVWRVKNYLRVNPSTPTDEQLEEDVQQALRSNPYVDRYDIVVTVRDGVATLVGKVDTWYEKAEADDVAARVYGVTAVNNNLKVEDGKEVYTHDPLVDEWYIYDYDWYERPDRDGTKKTDWEISEDVQDQFFWSPFVDGDQVRVTVEGGIVTLEGLVDTWAERAAATENAYEAGAVAVDNNLRVSYGPDYYAP